jgi:hypothetical protein
MKPIAARGAAARFAITLETIDRSNLTSVTGGQGGQQEPKMLPVYGAGDAKAVYCDLGHNPYEVLDDSPGRRAHVPRQELRGLCRITCRYRHSAHRRDHARCRRAFTETGRPRSTHRY